RDAVVRHGRRRFARGRGSDGARSRFDDPGASAGGGDPPGDPRSDVGGQGLRMFGEPARPAGTKDLAWFLVGAAGLSACVTLVFLGMRSIMDIGGSCADGGPYVSANPCPGGVALVMSLAFPAGFGFAALSAWAGSRLGGGYASFPLLAWPALFISLGWNFLDYGLVSAPPGEGPVWGFVVP